MLNKYKMFYLPIMGPEKYSDISEKYNLSIIIYIKKDMAAFLASHHCMYQVSKIKLQSALFKIDMMCSGCRVRLYSAYDLHY